MATGTVPECVCVPRLRRLSSVCSNRGRVPKTFDEFQKAPCRDGQFYFLKPRGRTDRRVHEADSLDEHDDVVEHDEYEHHMYG